MASSVKCVAAILAKDEAGRYLEQTIESLRPLVDKILLLDDNSTDRTRELAWDLGCHVRKRDGSQMWGNESPARQELWAWGKEECGDGWLYISDADHLTGANPDGWRQMLTSWNVNAWAFPLLDLWDSPTTFRADGFWQGYTIPRPWLFRPSKVSRETWNDRGIHCGHAPNADWVVGLAPASMAILHLGWLREADRVAKHLRYAEQGDKLSVWERQHLDSALETA